MPTLRERVTAFLQPPPRPLVTGELAVADMRRGITTANFPTYTYNPDDLVGRKGLRVYDEMRRDEQVKACLLLQKCALVGPGWKLEPADDSQGAQDLADVLTADLLRLPGTFEDVLLGILTAVEFGFSISEIIYDVRDSRLVVRAIKTRAPFGFDFLQDAFGNITSILQQQLGGRIELPPDKFVHFVNWPEWDNPYGTSDLRAAYNAWFHKQAWVQWWAIWGEKLATSPVVATHPRGEDERAKALLGLMKKMQAGSAFTLPEGFTMDLLESSRDARALFETAINRHDIRISRALLMPEKLGYSGGEVAGGSYALAQTQQDTWMLVLGLRGKRLEAVMNEQVIAPMAALESVTAAPPTFVLLPLSEENKAAVTDIWNKAVTAGAVQPDLDTEDHIRELLGFPEAGQQNAALWDELHRRKSEPVVVPGDVPPADGTPPPPTKPPTQEAMPPAKMADGLPTARDLTPPPDGGFWRTLSAVEKRADMAEKQATFRDLTPPLAEALATGAAAMVADLKARVKRGGLAKPGANPADVRGLTLGTKAVTATRKAVRDALQAGYERGAKDARGEIGRARAQMSAAQRAEHEPRLLTFAAQPGLVGAKAASFFNSKAFWITGLLEDSIVKNAQVVLFNAIKGDRTERQVNFELDQAVGEFLPETDAQGNIVNVPARLETIARTNIAEAVNEGRWALFTDPDLEGFVTAVRYSAVLDSRTRDNHRAWDGVTRPTDDTIWFSPVDERPPAGFNCRCLLVPVTIVDNAQLTPDSEIPSVPAADPGFR